MAGYATDSWTQTFRVRVPDGPEVVVTLASDGVNEAEASATVDGQPAELLASLEVLVDGIMPGGIECWKPGGCTYVAIDEEDLEEHWEANPLPGCLAAQGPPLAS